jgi:LysR family transcriptional regulator for bpeEF and oprC
MVPLTGVAAFVAVVRSGSFVRASATLDLTTSAVSRSVARLEKELGVRLLQRTTRKVTLTEEGRAYFSHCEHLLESFDEAGEAVRRRRAALSGRLRVEVSVAFGRVVLMPALSRFMQANPELELELRMTDRIADLLEDGIDAAVRIGVQSDSSLVAQTIGTTRFATVAAPSLLAGKTIRRPSDLAQLPQIQFMQVSTGRRRPWYFERKGVREELTPGGRLAIASGDALVEAAVRGLGVIQTMDFLAAPQLKSGQLVQVLRPWVAPGPPVSVVYPTSRFVSARVRAFTDFVREALQTG